MERTARGLTRGAATAAAIAAASACGHAPKVDALDHESRAHLRGDAVVASADPTVRGAHVVPEAVDAVRAFGLEPGGGVRAIAAGVRVVGLPGGAMLSADDRLPQTPSSTSVLPDRLGGGFLFVLGPTIWRAERWLSTLKPIFTSSAVIARVVVGLDRVYVRSPNGATQAFDPRTGARLDLGPWPGSSFVGAYAAADGWRAVAVNDLRGVVATFDAGATWKPLDLPIDPKDVYVVRDLLVVGGSDAAHATAWFEVRPDGQVARTTASAAFAPAAAGEGGASAPADAPHAFGRRPLVAAIEDGYPLADGTAIVARDGALGRVRLADGALVDVARDAYPLKPSRCHAIALGATRATARGAASFGFVCGEVRGKTVIYGYDLARGAMLEERRFDAPRAVLAAGNGAAAVRGGCGAGESDGERDGPSGERAYCLRSKEGGWREIRVRGATGSERVVPLADGRLAVVSPPDGNLAAARLSLLGGFDSRTVPIAFPALDQDLARVARAGAWLDGFEERTPGVLGGWIEMAGTFLGIQIDLDGTARVGKFIRDLGTPMVSGRYGLGWSASRRAYETLDGGMTWSALEVPEPLVPPRMIPSRACGPIGCTAAGWLRVGWGDAARAPLPDPPPAQRAPLSPPAPLELDCAPFALPAPPQVTAASGPPAVSARPAQPSRPSPAPPAVFQSGLALLGGFGSLGSGDLTPFYAAPAPGVRGDEVALTVEALDIVARAARTGPLARLYAWGPKTGEWDKASRWSARWVWPYGDSAEVRSTAASTTPFTTIEGARRTLGAGSAAPSIPGAPTTFWTIALGDDPQHALFLGRRNSPLESTVLILDEGRPIAEAHRDGREPFGDIEGATRAGRRWYVATAQGPGELPATVIWQLEGALARELTRVPRAGEGVRPFATHLARHDGGRAIGLVVDGQPLADRYLPARWVLPIDTETGKVSDPELLGTTDLVDRPPIAVCQGDEGGWVIDAPWTGAALRLKVGDQSLGAMQSLMTRLHMRRDRTCVEAISGSLEYAQLSRPDAARAADNKAAMRRDEDSSLAAAVSVFSGRARHALRCRDRAPQGPGR